MCPFRSYRGRCGLLITGETQPQRDRSPERINEETAKNKTCGCSAVRGSGRSNFLDVTLFCLLIKGAFKRLCTTTFQDLAQTPVFVPPL